MHELRKDLLNRLDELTDKYEIIDTHAMKLFQSFPYKRKIPIETKITAIVMGIPFFLTGLFVFVFMLPIRLCNDIKLVFRDLINMLTKE